MPEYWRMVLILTLDFYVVHTLELCLKTHLMYEMVLLKEKAKASVMPEQQINEKALTNDANGPTSFTPYIKYQKLEFKVWDRIIYVSIIFQSKPH